MTTRDRTLQAGAIVLVLAHAVAFLFFPGTLWGLSHLAVWPLPMGIACTALALVLLVAWPRRATGRAHHAWPGWRGTVLAAAAAALFFWLLRERAHFFGDGSLLLRDAGLSESVGRARGLVGLVRLVIAAGTRAGASVETSFALLSVAAGAMSVALALRLAAALAALHSGRLLVLVLLLGTGTMQLFCGHVEYYAVLAAGVLAWMLAGVHAASGRAAWPSWVLLGVLLGLHLSTVALLPAQIVLAVQRRRHGIRRTLAGAATAAGATVAVFLLAARGDGGRPVLEGGAARYIVPFLHAPGHREAFRFLAPAHLLAIANDLLLLAPVPLCFLSARRRRAALRDAARDPVALFLGTATAGAVAFGMLFHRDLGPYRDWDILAATGFLIAAWAGALCVRAGVDRHAAAVAIAAVAGAFHLLPWLALQMSPDATLRHVRLVLGSQAAWSAHARGYMQEEIALFLKRRGDTAGSLAAYEAAVAASPRDARYHVGVGTQRFQQGDLEGAAAAFANAIALRENYAPAQNDLAYVLAMLGRDLETARAHALAAVRLSPRRADFWVTLGQVERARGDLDAARRAVDQALWIQPRFAPALRLRALLEGAAPPGDATPLGRRAPHP